MAEKYTVSRGGSRRPGFALLAVLLSISSAGCYSYAPISPAAVQPGSSVRVRVLQPLPAGEGDALAPGQRLFRGKLLQPVSPDTLPVAVMLSSSDPLMPSRGLRTTVLVPVANLERLEVRHFQKGRTAAVVATGAVVGALVVNWAFDVTLPGQESGGDGGGTNNLRLPLFRLRW